MRRAKARRAAWCIAGAVAYLLVLAGCEVILGTSSLSDRVPGDGGGGDSTLKDGSGSGGSGARSGSGGSGNAASGSISDGGGSGSSTSGSGAASGSSGSAGSGTGSSGTGSGTMSGASSGGTGSSSGGDGGGGSGSASGNDGGSASGSASGSGTVTSVLQFHGGPSRDGLYTDPAFTATTGVSTLHLDSTFNVSVNGNVYAQPIYVPNGGPSGGEMFIVATEANYLIAVDAAGNRIWQNVIGAAVSSGLPCGDISPLGITGTPVVDATSSVIYFDTMTTGPKHLIHGVSLANGSIEQPGFPIDVSAKIMGFDSAHQNQRGALLLVNNVLYVPYGGHYGDCGPYYGYVVGVPLSSPGSPIAWHTTASAGGIWAVGGLASDGTSIFAATGNTTGTGGTWGDGEGILRLTSSLTFSGQSTDYFAPSAWANDDNADLDLGSTAPVLFQISGAHYALALGKDKTLYILNHDNLGGVGGALSSTVVANGEIIGAAAVYTTSQGTYVAFRVNGSTPTGCPGVTGGNLGAAKITPGTPPTAAVAWCVAETGLGSPIVTTTGGGANVIVWDANTRLYGYDGDTGTKVYLGGGAGDVMAAGMHKFGSPIVANGRIVIATSSDTTNTATPEHLYVFKP
jgi:hypothetical protein